MCTGGWHCLIPTPYLQRQKYPVSPLPTWDVSTAAVKWSKDEQVYFLSRQEYTPQPLVVLLTQFGTKSTENRLILKFQEGSWDVQAWARTTWQMGTALPFILFVWDDGSLPEEVPCCKEAKCRQAVATEMGVHTFSFTLLFPQAILPFIKTFPHREIAQFFLAVEVS